MGSLKWDRQDVAIAGGALVSAGFTVFPWALFFGAKFPAMDDGAIGLELSIDGGANYNPVIDPVDGADAELLASGSDSGWVDFSDWIRFAGNNDRWLLRFTCAAQVSGAVTVKVIQRG